jgi:hypothetical protein
VGTDLFIKKQVISGSNEREDKLLYTQNIVLWQVVACGMHCAISIFLTVHGGHIKKNFHMKKNLYKGLLADM